eukprot:superscaffoldBa00011733_g25345
MAEHPREDYQDGPHMPRGPMPGGLMSPPWPNTSNWPTQPTAGPTWTMSMSPPVQMPPPVSWPLRNRLRQGQQPKPPLGPGENQEAAHTPTNREWGTNAISTSWQGVGAHTSTSTMQPLQTSSLTQLVSVPVPRDSPMSPESPPSEDSSADDARLYLQQKLARYKELLENKLTPALLNKYKQDLQQEDKHKMQRMMDIYYHSYSTQAAHGGRQPVIA